MLFADALDTARACRYQLRSSTQLCIYWLYREGGEGASSVRITLAASGAPKGTPTTCFRERYCTIIDDDRTGLTRKAY